MVGTASHSPADRGRGRRQQRRVEDDGQNRNEVRGEFALGKQPLQGFRECAMLQPRVPLVLDREQEDGEREAGQD